MCGFFHTKQFSIPFFFLIYFSLALLGLCCCGGSSPVAEGGGRSLMAPGLQGVQTQWLWLRICCPTACWDLRGPGTESVSPALTGQFFTTEPPGKPSVSRWTPTGVLAAWSQHRPRTFRAWPHTAAPTPPPMAVGGRGLPYFRPTDCKLRFFMTPPWGQ